MILHLIRHAEAAEVRDEALDSERALTAKGHTQTRRLARALSRLEIRYDAIITSPLRRACETARELRSHGQTLEVSELLAMTPGEALLGLLRSRAALGTTSLALVGHEPFLSELVSLLLVGTLKHADRFEFRKSSLYALEFGSVSRLTFVLPSSVLHRLEGHGG